MCTKLNGPPRFRFGQRKILQICNFCNFRKLQSCCPAVAAQWLGDCPGVVRVIDATREFPRRSRGYLSITEYLDCAPPQGASRAGHRPQIRDTQHLKRMCAHAKNRSRSVTNGAASADGSLEWMNTELRVKIPGPGAASATPEGQTRRRRGTHGEDGPLVGKSLRPRPVASSS